MMGRETLARRAPSGVGRHPARCRESLTSHASRVIGIYLNPKTLTRSAPAAPRATLQAELHNAAAAVCTPPEALSGPKVLGLRTLKLSSSVVKPSRLEALRRGSPGGPCREAFPFQPARAGRPGRPERR